MRIKIKSILKDLAMPMLKVVNNQNVYNSQHIWHYRALAKKRWHFRYKYYQLVRKCGAFLPLDAEFEDMPVFPHGIFGVFVSGGAKVGKNCVIFHQVTIGSNTLKDSKNVGGT